jgi:hypothetical protein
MDATRTALLHIGEEQTTLTLDTGDAPTTTLALAVGIESTARAYFRHNPPSALDMETAIAAVEDVVMPALRQLPAGLALNTSDAAVHRIALLAGVPEGPRMVLSIDAMEACFVRLAAVVQGRPSTQDVLPTDNGFAAALLILRELMHHLGFDRICWVQALAVPH